MSELSQKGHSYHPTSPEQQETELRIYKREIERTAGKLHKLDLFDPTMKAIAGQIDDLAGMSNTASSFHNENMDLETRARRDILERTARYIETLRSGEKAVQNSAEGQIKEVRQPALSNGANTVYQITRMDGHLPGERIFAFVRRTVHVENGKLLNNNQFPHWEPDKYTPEQAKYASEEVLFAYNEEDGESYTLREISGEDYFTGHKVALKLLTTSERQLDEALEKQAMPRWSEDRCAIAVLPLQSKG